MTISRFEHKDYVVELNPKPGSSTEHDWDFYHKDWDDGDERYGHGKSAHDCIIQIDEMEREIQVPQNPIDYGNLLYEIAIKPIVENE